MSDNTESHYKKIVNKLARQLLAENGAYNPSAIETETAGHIVISAVAAIGDRLPKFGSEEEQVDTFNRAVADVNVLLRLSQQCGWRGRAAAIRSTLARARENARIRQFQDPRKWPLLEISPSNY